MVHPRIKTYISCESTDQFLHFSGPLLSPLAKHYYYTNSMQTKIDCKDGNLSSLIFRSLVPTDKWYIQELKPTYHVNQQTNF